MYSNKKEPEKEYLNLLYEYKDGKLFHKINRNRLAKKGQRAGGYNNQGYRFVMIHCKQYVEHRIIWVMINGEIPDKMVIDHINRIKDDNRIENLRLATESQNGSNTKERENNSGFRGVSYHKKKITKKYSAYISINQKRIHLGYFDTPEEASEKYKKTAEELFKEFKNFE